MIIYLWPYITIWLKPSFVKCRASLISRLMLLRMGFTREFSYHLPCELLPHISTITDHVGIYFLLHYPWSRRHRVLPGTLLYGARTFLTHIHARNHLNYFLNINNISYHFHFVKSCIFLEIWFLNQSKTHQALINTFVCNGIGNKFAYIIKHIGVIPHCNRMTNNLKQLIVICAVTKSVNIFLIYM